jgi:hypothetical protein
MIDGDLLDPPTAGLVTAIPAATMAAQLNLH